MRLNGFSRRLCSVGIDGLFLLFWTCEGGLLDGMHLGRLHVQEKSVRCLVNSGFFMFQRQAGSWEGLKARQFACSLWLFAITIDVEKCLFFHDLLFCRRGLQCRARVLRATTRAETTGTLEGEGENPGFLREPSLARPYGRIHFLPISCAFDDARPFSHQDASCVLCFSSSSSSLLSSSSSRPLGAYDEHIGQGDTGDAVHVPPFFFSSSSLSR